MRAVEIERQTLVSFCRAKDMEFEIRHDPRYPDLGYYLYVYDQDGFCERDYLQDTVEYCKEQVQEDFDIVMDNWEDAT